MKPGIRRRGIQNQGNRQSVRTRRFLWALKSIPSRAFTVRGTRVTKTLSKLWSSQNAAVGVERMTTQQKPIFGRPMHAEKVIVHIQKFQVESTSKRLPTKCCRHNSSYAVSEIPKVSLYAITIFPPRIRSMTAGLFMVVMCESRQ